MIKGTLKGCVVFATHKLYTPEVAEIETRCKRRDDRLFRLQNPFDGNPQCGTGNHPKSACVWAKRTDDVKDILGKAANRPAPVAAATMKVFYRRLKSMRCPQEGTHERHTPSPVRPPAPAGTGIDVRSG